MNWVQEKGLTTMNATAQKYFLANFPQSQPVGGAPTSFPVAAICGGGIATSHPSAAKGPAEQEKMKSYKSEN